MTTSTYELQIVGLFHHPPAMALSRLIPLNANLWVRAEPTNSFDHNAIAVDLDIDLLNLGTRQSLRREIKEAFDYFRSRHPENGLRFEDVEKEGFFHLGYISATDALWMKTHYPDFARYAGTFRVGEKAKPFVRFSLDA